MNTIKIFFSFVFLASNLYAGWFFNSSDNTIKQTDINEGETPWVLRLKVSSANRLIFWSSGGCVKQVGTPTVIDLSKPITNQNGTAYYFTDLYNSLFNGKTTITDVILPDTVTTINSEAFRGCTKLKSVVFGKAVKTIGAKCFFGSSAVTNVSDSVDEINVFSATSIGESAFNGTSGLKGNLVIKGNVTLGKGAFYGSGILSFTVQGELVGSLQPEAFRSCSNLKCVVLSTGEVSQVTAFASKVFLGCSNLEEILPYRYGKITSFDTSTLQSVKNLKSQIEIVHNGTVSLGGASIHTCGITNFISDAHVKLVGNENFRECLSLREVRCNNGITIGAYTDFCRFDTNIKVFLCPNRPSTYGNNYFGSTVNYQFIVYGSRFDTSTNGWFHTNNYIPWNSLTTAQKNSWKNLTTEQKVANNWPLNRNPKGLTKTAPANKWLFYIPQKGLTLFLR